MRQIKFRAWDKKNKKMIPWGEDLISQLGTIIKDKENFVLMQYTGLDTNNEATGKKTGEIYDGDLLVEEEEDQYHTHDFSCFDPSSHKKICRPVIKTVYEVGMDRVSEQYTYTFGAGIRIFKGKNNKLDFEPTDGWTSFKIVGNIYEQ